MLTSGAICIGLEGGVTVDPLLADLLVSGSSLLLLLGMSSVPRQSCVVSSVAMRGLCHLEFHSQCNIHECPGLAPRLQYYLINYIVSLWVLPAASGDTKDPMAICSSHLATCHGARSEQLSAWIKLVQLLLDPHRHNINSLFDDVPYR